MKKVTEVYIINDLNRLILTEPGTKCTVLSETERKAQISFEDRSGGTRTITVPKRALGIDVVSLDIYTTMDKEEDNGKEKESREE